jgi:hypothetical protein
LSWHKAVDLTRSEQVISNVEDIICDNAAVTTIFLQDTSFNQKIVGL